MLYLSLPFSFAVLIALIMTLPSFPAAIGQLDGLGSTPVTGTYIGDGGQIEWELPSGWQGFEIRDNNFTIMISGSDGIDLEADKIYSKPMVALISTSDTKLDPADIYELLPSKRETDLKCSGISTWNTRINEATGLASTLNCQIDENKSLKMSSVLMRTDKSLVTVIYIAPSESYEEHYQEFEDSLKSLKIFGAIDLVPDGSNLERSSFAIESGETSVDMEVQSSSSIQDVEFVESERYIKFQVHGNDSMGITILPIGRILEGPYTVTIDGQTVKNLEIVEEKPSGESLVKLTYPKGTHSIVISGTHVVPEFTPYIVMGASTILTVVITTAIRFKRISAHLVN